MTVSTFKNLVWKSQYFVKTKFSISIYIVKTDKMAVC